MIPSDPLSLADWRRAVAEMYGEIRHTAVPQTAWRIFRQTRDDLFRSHLQSPLDAEQRARFRQLPYFPYDAAFRVMGRVDTAVTPHTFEVDLPHDGRLRFTRIATVHFAVKEQAGQLSLFWVEGYGGGLFLPFRDGTNGRSAYGGGRYLYDGIKGADLGAGQTKILLDFNFAYNPSCAYNVQWVCPLPPPENHLPFPINAGEKYALL